MGDTAREKTTATGYAEPREDLAPGTRHAGFVVEGVEAIPEISGVAYVMRHEASGARAMWLACDDENKAFSIAFKTPPADSTGVFHILEHSVLCGSDDYPVKEPFVNLLKTSMQTFLNALTFPDKTMYPVASTNGRDLENLMGVYLDAVLHPAIYDRPRIFEQEGWHYELADEDAPLTYNGVVFNEMKGALSDPDEVLFEALDDSLFPDSPYRFESGGDPRVIPTLTYERFLDAHARHYQLSNSYTILYGDLDVDRELAFVDERFSAATDRGAGDPNPLPLQAPVRPPLSTRSMATSPENASVGLGYVVGTSGERERVLACDVLLDALMGSNEAPLKRAILDAGLGDDAISYLMDGLAQPIVVLQLKGARSGVAQEFRELVERTCAELARDGIGHDNLASSLAQAEFNLREGDWGYYADGVALAMQAMDSWLYDDDDPTSYLHYEDAVAHMRAGLDDDYFERLLSELVCDSEHSAEVDLVPTDQGDAAEEAAELAARRRSMSDDDVRATIDEVAALRAEQAAPDSPENVARLPQLAVADIGPVRPEPPMVAVDAPLPCVRHDIPTHHIDYVYAYFDLGRIGWEELPYVSILADLLGKLDTTAHTAAELDTLIEANLGSLSFFPETYGDDHDPMVARPTMVVGASALSENADKAATIPAEVWSSTLFEDKARIRDILQQRRISMEQSFVGAGHLCALSRVSSYFSKAALVGEMLGGVDHYLFLKGLLDDFDNRYQGLCDLLRNLCGRVFVSGNVTLSFTGPEEDLGRYWQAAGSLGLGDGGPAGSGRVLEVPTPTVRNEAFVVPANVCFVGEGTDGQALGCELTGSWQVAARALSLDYLWNEVRVRGGAYGCGFRCTADAQLQCYSYRDPAVDPTVGRFEGSAGWLADWTPTEDEFSGYVVSTVAGHDAPVKARARARRQDIARRTGRPDDFLERLRAQELACTVDSVRELAAKLGEMPRRRGICVFGGRDIVAASGLDLDVTELMGSNGEA